ncbi:MAG: hypothetical protein GY866_12350, partial [Proteobacteria bacterium]|nr:hypothetical protein [Pseudomonadota bacterium]
MDSIRQKQEELENRLHELNAQVRKAEQTSHEEEKRLLTLDGQLKQLKENLESISVEGTEEDLAKAEGEVDKKTKKQEETEKRLNEKKERKYGLEAEIKLALENKAKTETRWQKQASQTKPVLKSWRIFREQAKEEGKLERLLSEYFSEIQTKKRKPDLFWRQESASRATLIKILERVPNTQLVLERIKAVASGNENEDETDQGEECLFIWRQINGYLDQVIPVDLQTSDPEKAQQTIAIKLETLEQNLEQQERSLRQHVETIPSHINAKIRKEKTRIRKLNQKLEKVTFGFLQAIRINIETQPKLKEFLDLLPQQLDFFTETKGENVPIETLMASLYEQVGAGKVKGDLLLDYRHYVRMNIEVKREGNQ